MKRTSRVKDVAAAAGVSVATVSRTYNSPTTVREEVRRRVLKAADRLDYRPHPAARALRSRRSHIVGAVIPTLDHAIFSPMINALQIALHDSGFGLFVATSGFDSATVGPVAASLIDRGAEALLLVGTVDDGDLLGLVRAKNIPVVATYSFHENGRIPFIGFDNFQSTYKIAEYLILLGHRDIAMVSGPTEGNDRQQSRIAAFRRALADYAVVGDPPLIVEKPYSIAHGADSLCHILRERPRTTAVICNADILAFGVLTECRRRGIAVPDALSVAGHDDQDFANYLEPPLTTVAVPADEMGRRTAEALLDAVNTGAPIVGLRLPTSLVIRGSTAPPRKV